jgi:hypothetical protein
MKLRQEGGGRARGAPATEESFRAAADAELAEARPLPGNEFKLPLARNPIVATLLDLVRGAIDRRSQVAAQFLRRQRFLDNGTTVALLDVLGDRLPQLVAGRSQQLGRQDTGGRPRAGHGDEGVRGLAGGPGAGRGASHGMLARMGGRASSGRARRPAHSGAMPC